MALVFSHRRSSVVDHLASLSKEKTLLHLFHSFFPLSLSLLPARELARGHRGHARGREGGALHNLKVERREACLRKKKRALIEKSESPRLRLSETLFRFSHASFHFARAGREAVHALLFSAPLRVIVIDSSLSVRDAPRSSQGGDSSNGSDLLFLSTSQCFRCLALNALPPTKTPSAAPLSGPSWLSIPRVRDGSFAISALARSQAQRKPRRRVGARDKDNSNLGGRWR